MGKNRGRLRLHERITRLYKVTNILETLVPEMVDSILPSLIGVCTCEMCRADVICLTLNQVKPRYVVHRYGEIMSRAEFEGLQKKAEIISVITRSARQIAGKPHSERPARFTDK